jgi:hypothetical protein
MFPRPEKVQCQVCLSLFILKVCIINIICPLRSQATWRRYIYLFPLNGNDVSGYDIDVDFVNKCLSKIENIELPYLSLSYRESDRLSGSEEGLKDRCVLYKARASIVDVANVIPSSGYTVGGSSEEHLSRVRFLDELGSELVTLQSSIDSKKNQGHSDDLTADLVNALSKKRELFDDTLALFDYTSGAKTLCIELVGSRFLRQMVRILAVKYSK